MFNKKIFVLAALLVILIIFLFCISEINSYKKLDLSGVDLSCVNKLMIVAHPDDETLWGGGHLSEGGYLVICLTNEKNKTRSDEFRKAVAQSGKNQGIILSFPDRFFFMRSKWTFCQKYIEKDIGYILSLKDWEAVITHNPDGEYGHIHHRMTSKTVTEYARKDKLWYFGVYYSKKRIGENALPPMTENILNLKMSLIKIYAEGSQKFISTSFEQMFPYENWIKAIDWSATE